MGPAEPFHDLVVVREGAVTIAAGFLPRGLPRLQDGFVQIDLYPLAIAFSARRQLLEIGQRRAELTVSGARRSGYWRSGS